MRIAVITPAMAALALASCSTHERNANDVVHLDRMAASIHDQLDGQVVGYAFVLGAEATLTGEGGLARTEADGEEIAFSADTPMIIASVSKLVSALATMSALRDHGVDLDDPIGPYLPSDWTVDPYLQGITFTQLLNQTSGIKDLGNGLVEYERLKTFFTRPVNPDSTTPCRGLAAPNPPDPVTPNNLDFCYSNFNAALLTVLLPRAIGLPEDPNPQTRPATLARQYQDIVQQTVFAPVGVADATCAASDNTYALAYRYPGDSPGRDWGPQQTACAAGGWYVSSAGLAKVLSSVASRDGRILEESDAYSSLDQIRVHSLGLDASEPDLIAKDGTLVVDQGALTTSAIVFDHNTEAAIPAVLFINSDSRNGRIVYARRILVQAFQESLGPSGHLDEN